MNSILIGAHQSIAGGIWKAIERAHGINTDTLQIFTKNSNRWRGKEISVSDVERYNALHKQYNIKSVIAHSAYLINLASDNNNTIKNSVTSLSDEIKNCEILNIPYLVMHPGSHKGSGVKNGIKRIVENLNSVFERTDESNVKILLETTAGQGNSVGHNLEHLHEIKEKVLYKERVGYCLDTCHLFAAGYDFRDMETYSVLREKIENTLGSENVKVIHLNDSKRELGSRVDRHEHIGKGKIGLQAFSFFINDTNFKNVSFIIETPKENNMDNVNITLLKNLIKR